MKTHQDQTTDPKQDRKRPITTVVTIPLVGVILQALIYWVLTQSCTLRNACEVSTGPNESLMHTKVTPMTRIARCAEMEVHVWC